MHDNAPTTCGCASYLLHGRGLLIDGVARILTLAESRTRLFAHRAVDIGVDIGVLNVVSPRDKGGDFFVVKSIVGGHFFMDGPVADRSL